MPQYMRIVSLISVIGACALLAATCSDSTPSEPSPSILVNPGAIGVPASGQTASTIAVTANVAWTAAADSSAVTITSGASGTGNGTITYTVAANSGPVRTAHIAVTGNTAVATVTLTQAGATAR